MEEPKGGERGTARRGPGWLPAALVAAATVLAVVSTFTTWVRAEALDTDQWVELSTDLLDNPEIQRALSVFLVDELYQQIDVTAEIEDKLPDDLKGLAGPLSGTLRGPATAGVERLIASDQFRSVWSAVNRRAHQTMVNILRNETRGGVSTGGGVVTLDLNELVRDVGKNLGLSDSLLDRIPPNAGSITVFESGELKKVQRAVQILDFLSWFLFLAVVALYAAAVYLASDRRLQVLRNSGLSLIVAGVFVLIVRLVAVRMLLDALVTSSANRPWAHVSAFVATGLLRQMAWSGIVYGIIIVLFAVLLGDRRWAAATRRILAPALNASRRSPCRRDGAVRARSALVEPRSCLRELGDWADADRPPRWSCCSAPGSHASRVPKCGVRGHHRVAGRRVPQGQGAVPHSAPHLLCSQACRSRANWRLSERCTPRGSSATTNTVPPSGSCSPVADLPPVQQRSTRQRLGERLQRTLEISSPVEHRQRRLFEQRTLCRLGRVEPKRHARFERPTQGRHALTEQIEVLHHSSIAGSSPEHGHLALDIDHPTSQTAPASLQPIGLTQTQNLDAALIVDPATTTDDLADLSIEPRLHLLRVLRAPGRERERHRGEEDRTAPECEHRQPVRRGGSSVVSGFINCRWFRFCSRRWFRFCSRRWFRFCSRRWFRFCSRRWFSWECRCRGVVAVTGDRGSRATGDRVAYGIPGVVAARREQAQGGNSDQYREGEIEPTTIGDRSDTRCPYGCRPWRSGGRAAVVPCWWFAIGVRGGVDRHLSPRSWATPRRSARA